MDLHTQMHRLGFKFGEYIKNNTDITQYTLDRYGENLVIMDVSNKGELLQIKFYDNELSKQVALDFVKALNIMIGECTNGHD